MRFAPRTARPTRHEAVAPTPVTPARPAPVQAESARSAAASPRYLSAGLATETSTANPAPPLVCPAPLTTFPLLAAYLSVGPQFDAAYFPSAPALAPDALFITHRVHVAFQPFSRQLVRDQPELFGAYRQLRLSPAQRAACQWTDAERDSFKSDFIRNVGKAWSGRYVFATDEPCFAHYRATPRVAVQFVDDAAAAHSTVVAYKMPPAAARLRSEVRGGSEARLDGRDPSVETRHWTLPFDAVLQVGPFDLGRAEINAEVEADLREVAAALRPHLDPRDPSTPFGPGAQLDFHGRASSEGSVAHNQALARRRADNTRHRLNAILGIPPSNHWFISMDEPGERNASTEATFRRVDIWFDVGHTGQSGGLVPQNTAAHEFGHLIGLGDEYEDEVPPSGVLPKFAGDRPTHHADVEAAMGRAAADELLIQNNNSIMSKGSEVRRGHYVHFLNRLREMTHKAWVIE